MMLHRLLPDMRHNKINQAQRGRPKAASSQLMLHEVATGQHSSQLHRRHASRAGSPPARRRHQRRQPGHPPPPAARRTPAARSPAAALRRGPRPPGSRRSPRSRAPARHSRHTRARRRRGRHTPAAVGEHQQSVHLCNGNIGWHMLNCLSKPECAQRRTQQQCKPDRGLQVTGQRH